MKQIFAILTTLLTCGFVANAQFKIKGTIVDSSGLNLVEGVKVQTKSGAVTFSDSVGRYQITVQENDSIFFTFRNKPTQKFSVYSVYSPENFDVKLLVKVRSRYKVLDEVIVRAKSYNEQYLENRETYKKIFESKPGQLETSTLPTGGVGLDINSLINLFRFRRNKQLAAFKTYLENEEKEKYISYRFSPKIVSRITGLKDEELKQFMKTYRPDYEFTIAVSDILFYQYILDSYYHYRKIDLPKGLIKRN